MPAPKRRVFTLDRFHAFADLPDELIATIFSFLPLPSVLKAARVDRIWRTILSMWDRSIEGSLCDVDPFAALGPAHAYTALHPKGPKPGLSPLELLRRRGNPACALCGDWTHLLDQLEVSRVCNECAKGLEEEATVPCYNRFLFTGSVELHVSDEEGLREAIDDAEQEGSPSTIVMTADIELSATLEG